MVTIVEAYRAIITEYQITLTYNFYMVCIYTFELVLEAMLSHIILQDIIHQFLACYLV